MAWVLSSTHNLCFGAKIRKIGIPLHTPVLLYKSWVQGGIHAVLMSTHNLCFGAKLRKIGIPQFCYVKVGFKGVYMTMDMFS